MGPMEKRMIDLLQDELDCIKGYHDDNDKLGEEYLWGVFNHNVTFVEALINRPIEIRKWKIVRR